VELVEELERDSGAIAPVRENGQVQPDGIGGTPRARECTVVGSLRVLVAPEVGEIVAEQLPVEPDVGCHFHAALESCDCGIEVAFSGLCQGGDLERSAEALRLELGRDLECRIELAFPNASVALAEQGLTALPAK